MKQQDKFAKMLQKLPCLMDVDSLLLIMYLRWVTNTEIVCYHGKLRRVISSTVVGPQFKEEHLV